jgi:hypothetical protein
LKNCCLDIENEVNALETLVNPCTCKTFEVTEEPS